MKVRFLFALLPLILMSSTCSDDDKNCHDRIVFTNKTNNILYVNGEDSIILSVYNGRPYSDWNKVLPGGENNTGLLYLISGRSYCYENGLTDTLHIFIFEEDVLATYTWQEVVDNYMVLQRYDLSLQDLQTLDWQISYPPTKTMKNMKMYPPYEE